MMRMRAFFTYLLPLMTLLACSGCASRPPAPSSDEAQQIAAEISMLQEQSDQIIAEVQKRDMQGGDRIMPNDELTIEVWMRDRKTQFAGFPLHRDVPGSGKLFIPHIGVTVVTGKTDDELKALLSEHFDRILKEATVVVEHSRRVMPGRAGQPVRGMHQVSLLGWVGRPGLYALEPGLTTIRDLIATAGDTKQYANTKRIYVVRGDLDDPQVVKVNLAKVLTGKDTKQNIVLYHNDAVYVPPIRMWKTYDVIRIILLPLSAVRDAIWVGQRPFDTD